MTVLADLAIGSRTKRFAEYDKVVASDPERWMLFLGNAAARNRLGVGDHIGLVMEMDVLIGYFAKTYESTLLSTVFRR